MNIERLQQPIDPKRVKDRQGSGGRRLSYIEAHDAIRTANDIFEFGGWGYETVSLDHIATERFTRNGKNGIRVGYRALVKVTLNGYNVAFSDVGYGDAIEYTDSEITPHELAAKEAVSDALKRALKNFGDQFGLGLYDKDAPAPQATQAGSAGASVRTQTKVEQETPSKAEPPVSPAPFAPPEGMAKASITPAQKKALWNLMRDCAKLTAQTDEAFLAGQEHHHGPLGELSKVAAQGIIDNLQAFKDDPANKTLRQQMFVEEAA